MTVARIQNLTIRYGPKFVINNLSVEIPEGAVGLLGPNGAGKTTLIKALLGFIQPVSGQIKVLGMDVAAESLRIRQRIGLMPEVDCYIPNMSGVAFVAYAGELSGMPSREAWRRAHEVLEYCGLDEARYRNLETYSTGMRQRVKLAQALVHGPRLLFLDEPTNGLDPSGREEMLRLIEDVSHGKGVNVILSSHLLPDVERICDKVIVLNQGRVVLQGDVAVLKERGGVQFEVELYTASEAFIRVIEQRGARLLHQWGSCYRLMLNSHQEEAGRFFFECAQEAGAQIRGFRPAIRSLEDIFLEAVE